MGLFLASLFLRLVGIGWGLPNDFHNQTYHPDELVNYGVSQSPNILKPGFYSYGTAYFIAEKVAIAAVNTYGGKVDPKTPKDFWVGVGRGILVGRFLNAFAGAGAVVVLWLILRRITTLFGALFGAGLIALAPGFVVHSRYETVDVFAAFWLALSALFALRIVGAMPGSLGDNDHREPRDMRDAILAGLFAGVSTGTKYTGILVLIVLWISLGLTRRPGFWKPLLAGTGVCLAAFVLTTPGVFLDTQRFMDGVGFELGHTASGHGLVFVGTAPGFIYHLGNLAAGLGLLLTIGGSAGLLYGAWKRHPWAIAMLAFAIVYYIVIGRAEVKFLRYIFPLLVPLAVGYGYMMGSARRKGGWGHAVVAGGFIALAGLDFGGLSGTLKDTWFMVEHDSRDEAAIDLQRVAANGSVGLVSDPWFYSPPLIPDAGLNRDRLPAIYDEVGKADHPKVLRYIPNGDLSQRIDWDPRLLSELKPDYVVFSSFETFDLDRLTGVKDLDSATQATVDRYKQFLNQLQVLYSPSTAFGADTTPPIHDLMYIRPSLWVWKRKGLP